MKTGMHVSYINTKIITQPNCPDSLYIAVIFEEMCMAFIYDLWNTHGNPYAYNCSNVKIDTHSVPNDSWTGGCSNLLPCYILSHSWMDVVLLSNTPVCILLNHIRSTDRFKLTWLVHHQSTRHKFTTIRKQQYGYW